MQTESLQTRWTFAAGGGFPIVGNRVNGTPKGAIFSGIFTSPVNWVLNSPLSCGLNSHTLKGLVSGTPSGGFDTSGQVGQLVGFVFNSATGYFNGSLPLVSGGTSIVIPERGTLILLGTGILGAAGALPGKCARQS